MVAPDNDAAVIVSVPASPLIETFETSSIVIESLLSVPTATVSTAYKV